RSHHRYRRAGSNPHQCGGEARLLGRGIGGTVEDAPMNSAPPLLKAEGLEAAYGSSQVLFGIDLELRSGEVATLLGRNGMGKTTTVRALLGLTPTRSGRITFQGERVERRRPDQIARMGVALVPEGRQIFPNLSVRENLLAFAENRSGTS